MKGNFNGLSWSTSFDELSYDCSSCKTFCCRLYRVQLGERDIERLGGAASRVKDEDGRNFLSKDSSGVCMLLKDNLCSVHDIKPRLCRTYPVFLNPASDGSVKVDCTRVCPKGGQKVSEGEISDSVKIIAEEYGDYYPLQSQSYKNLTERLKDAHPLLSSLSKIEDLTKDALKESIGRSFNPFAVYNSVSSLGGNRISLEPSSNILEPVRGLFEAGVIAIDFNESVAQEIRLLEDRLYFSKRYLKVDKLEEPKLDSTEINEALDYLTELSRRGNASQYVIKSLRDGRKDNVFHAMASYLFYHASALAVYFNIYQNLEQAIMSKEYSLNRRVDTLLS